MDHHVHVAGQHKGWLTSPISKLLAYQEADLGELQQSLQSRPPHHPVLLQSGTKP